MGDLNGMWVRRPVGYCKLHQCVLSIKQMRGKECLAKGCWHLRRLEHTYWEQQKERKRAAKARRKAKQ